MRTTARRIEATTAPDVNREISERTQRSLRIYADANPEDVEARLEELEREWDVERVIELEGATTLLTGLALGTWVDPRFYGVSAFAAAMMLLHGLEGPYPLMPVLRRAGLRSAREIELEAKALRSQLRQPKEMPALAAE